MGSVPVGRKKRAERRRRPADVPLADRGGRLVGLAAVRRGEPDRPGRPGPGSPVAGRRGHLGAGHRRGLRHRAAPQDHRRRAPGSRSVNPLRDHRVGWACVTKVDLADLLRVHCRGQPGQGQREGHQRLGRALLAAPQARRGNQGPPAGRAGGSGRPSLGTFGLGAVTAAAAAIPVSASPAGAVVGRGGSRAGRPGAQRVRHRRQGRGGLGRRHRGDRRRRPGPRQPGRRQAGLDGRGRCRRFPPRGLARAAEQYLGPDGARSPCSSPR